jgi:hypothetical protein
VDAGGVRAREDAATLRDYRVAICTYRRAGLLEANTLRVLLAGGVAERDITLVVADGIEAAEYRRALGDRYPTLEYAISRRPGLGHQRNHAATLWAPGTRVVGMDDDVEGFLRLTPDGKRLEPLDDVHGLIVDGFARADAAGCRLWGVGAVANAFYMKPRWSVGLKYVCGPFHAYTTRPDDDRVLLRAALGGEKEDYERTLRYYERDGRVLRCDAVTVKHRWYRNPGGLEGQRTAGREAAVVAALHAEFPRWVTPRQGSRGYAEMRLTRGTTAPR